MCSIITYGFTVNGNLISGPTCSADIGQTIGAQVQAQFDDSEVGLTLIATVDLYRNGVRINTNPLISQEYTVPYAGAIAVFNIPFTGISMTAGTYDFGTLGASIHTPDFYSQYCYAETSTRCIQLTLSPPLKWKCSGSPNYTCSQTTDGTYDTEAACKADCKAPTTDKWKCSGSPNYTCSQTTDGTYDTEAACNDICKKEQPNNTILIIAGVGIGLGLLYYLTQRK